MADVDWHYILGGVTVLAGAVAFIKSFDFLARQSARRLLETARAHR